MKTFLFGAGTLEKICGNGKRCVVSLNSQNEQGLVKVTAWYKPHNSTMAVGDNICVTCRYRKDKATDQWLLELVAY